MNKKNLIETAADLSGATGQCLGLLLKALKKIPGEIRLDPRVKKKLELNQKNTKNEN